MTSFILQEMRWSFEALAEKYYEVTLFQIVAFHLIATSLENA